MMSSVGDDIYHQKRRSVARVAGGVIKLEVTIYENVCLMIRGVDHRSASYPGESSRDKINDQNKKQHIGKHTSAHVSD